MVLHNVYFWLHDSVTANEKNDFYLGIQTFLSAVDEVVKFEIGTPADTPRRDVVNHAYGYSIFVWFNSENEHDVYQTHPAHAIFINNFESLWANVQVFDSKI